MDGHQSLQLNWLDYSAFIAYLIVLSGIGWWAGRKEKFDADDYFLAGRTLPWYVVGGSFIASNISSEHFIGMIGAAMVYGICVAMAEWGNVLTFSMLIWFFIPFLLASRVFTAPEFMEWRFHPILRQFFADLNHHHECGRISGGRSLRWGGRAAKPFRMGIMDIHYFAGSCGRLMGCLWGLEIRRLDRFLHGDCHDSWWRDGNGAGP